MKGVHEALDFRCTWRIPRTPQNGFHKAGQGLLSLASSLNRYARTLAASTGWHILDSGTRLNTAKLLDSTPPEPATIGVLNIPLFLCQPARYHEE